MAFHQSQRTLIESTKILSRGPPYIFKPDEERVKLTIQENPRESLAIGKGLTEKEEGKSFVVKRVQNNESKGFHGRKLVTKRAVNCIQYAERKAPKGTIISCENSERPSFSSTVKHKNNRNFVFSDSSELYKDFESESDVSIRKVKKCLDSFRKILEKLKQNCQERKVSACCVSAARILKEEHGWINVDKQVGKVSGVKVGEQFTCRAELVVIGLHGEFIRGIDYLKMVDSTILATSIVDAGRHYANCMNSPNELIYFGEGENPCISKNNKPNDQKLCRGNLALKNSMEAKTPVRVIRRARKSRKRNDAIAYVYDGLYMVDQLYA